MREAAPPRVLPHLRLRAGGHSHTHRLHDRGYEISSLVACAEHLQSDGKRTRHIPALLKVTHRPHTRARPHAHITPLGYGFNTRG